MYKIILFFLVITHQSFFGQVGSYYGAPVDAAEFCSIQLQMTSAFTTNNEAQLAVNKIINAVGISQRFAIFQCNGIDNCQAVTIRGIRYIFYDSYFMKSISNSANSSWTNLSILAHEIGHHVNGHTVDIIAASTGQIESWSLSENRKREIEADEFSGYVLGKLGASLFEAQLAINLSSFTGDETYSTHPNKTNRLAAIERGYLKAKGLQNEIMPTTNKGNELAEYYFYLAYNNQFSTNPNSGYILENYNKAIQENPTLAPAYNNRGVIKKNQKQYSSALLDFDESIRLDSKNPAPYVNKGTIYVLQKDYSRAMELLNFAIEMDPKYAIAYNNRGGVKGALNDHIGAIKDFNISISLNSEFTLSYLSRGLSKGALQDWYGGISDLDVVINREPQNAFAYKMRGLQKMMIGANYCSDFQIACRLGDCQMYNQYSRNCR
jgi:tetratricopeptide (TPR) repeat protein